MDQSCARWYLTLADEGEQHELFKTGYYTLRSVK
jgi:hypothetical protein